jgi:serine/threonine protein kinase
VISNLERLDNALAPEFKVLRPIGEGAMAQVFLAREAALQRLVAIKVLRPELALDTIARKRFEREARSAAKLSHPAVVAVYRVGVLEDETPYLVMQYVEGRNLGDTVRAEGPLDEGDARQILAQLASALAAAHANGIIHRDVKPANVVWTRADGRAVLMDFGIAGIIESGNESTRLTTAGRILGDPGYMSPEQLLGEPLTEAADVYSLGILGYEILTGSGPYRTTNRAEQAAAHLRQEPQKLSTLRPGVSAALADLLERCLSKRPEHRPRAAEVARRLNTLDEPAAAQPAGGVIPPHTFSDATAHFPALDTFLAELKRRRVYNVAFLYAVAVFAILQGAELVLPSLPVRAGAYDVLVAIALGGFPLALVLGWMFDITSTGIRRSTSATGPAGRVKLIWLQAVGLALSLLLAGAIGWWILTA